MSVLDLDRRSGSKLVDVDDLMPIGEFSELSGLSAKRLRTYAGAGLLVPMAIDSATGYRYYSPGQLREAQVVETLRRAGVPLADVGAILRSPSAEQLDAWAEQVSAEATQRREALEAARRLLAVGGPSEPRPGKESMTTLKTAVRTECGPVRENNEDAVVCTDRLVAVADGMGGHPGGELAAAMAVALVQAGFTGRSLDELEAATRAANRAIWERAAGSSGLDGMGTTICAIGLTEDGQVVVTNVGDSRAYLLGYGGLSQISNDHSLTAELVRQGELSEDQAREHPQRGVLTRALGVGPDIELDSAVHPIQPGDRVLLCTDGLFNEVSVGEIQSSMSGGRDVQATADDLVELALSRGARDNVSVVVAEVAS